MLSTDQVYEKILENKSKRVKQEEPFKYKTSHPEIAKHIIETMFDNMTKKDETEATLQFQTVIGSNYKNSLAFEKNQSLLLDEIIKKLTGNKKIDVIFTYDNFDMYDGATYNNKLEVADVYSITFKFV